MILGTFSKNMLLKTRAIHYTELSLHCLCLQNPLFIIYIVSAGNNKHLPCGSSGPCVSSVYKLHVHG